MLKEDRKEIKKNKKKFPYFSISFWLVSFTLSLIAIANSFRNQPKVEGDMFSYAGGVVGGGMTLLGVIMTIIYNNETRKKDQEQRDEERKEDLAIQYKPFFSDFEKRTFFEKDLSIIDNYNYEIHDQNGDPCGENTDLLERLTVNVKITNTGRGEAKIKKVKMVNPVQSVKEVNVIYRYSNEGVIMKGEQFSFELDVSIINLEKLKNKEWGEQFYIEVEYTDLYNKFPYKKAGWLFVGMEYKGDDPFGYSGDPDDLEFQIQLNK